VFSSLGSLITGQALILGLILIVFAYLLAKMGLFHWKTTGFWTWCSFVLYFILNPLASMKWNYEIYQIYLTVGGGIPRGEWIGLVAGIGIIAFFVTYLFVPATKVTWRIKGDDFNWVMNLVRLGFISLAIVSFFTFRTEISMTDSDLGISGGRFIGATTGYEYVAHMFIFLPIMTLLFSRSRLNNLLAIFLTFGYVVFSMQAVWNRFATISILLAISLVITIRRKRKWPDPQLILITLILAAVLIIRGHSQIGSPQEFFRVFTLIPDKIGQVLASGDSSMLASWYVESFVKDHITGFDYGIPLINYAFFGFIPGRIFPQKYFLLDWLRANQNPLTDPAIVNLLFGAKTTLFGSFYANGGIIGVILLTALFAFFCRRIDGMLSEDAPLLVKSAGVSLLCVLWMVWGSSDYWGLMTMGVMILPAFFIWLFTRKVNQSATVQTEQTHPKIVGKQVV
jgi:hypothetical protein